MSNWVMTLTLDWTNTQGNFQSSSWLKDGVASNPPSGNNAAQVNDTINWCVQALNLPSGGYLSQLVVTVGKFQGNNDGSLGSPFQTGGGPMCLLQQTNGSASWSAPATGYQGFATASPVFQDANAKGKKSKYEFTLVAIYCDGGTTYREYGCDPEIDVDNGNG